MRIPTVSYVFLDFEGVGGGGWEASILGDMLSVCFAKEAISKNSNVYVDKKYIHVYTVYIRHKSTCAKSNPRRIPGPSAISLFCLGKPAATTVTLNLERHMSTNVQGRAGRRRPISRLLTVKRVTNSVIQFLSITTLWQLERI